MIQELEEILGHYDFNIDEYVGEKIITMGHINTTYILYFDLGNRVKRYLLQEINTYVFHNPEELMDNICRVTTYCHNLLKGFEVPNYHNRSLRVYYAKNGDSFVRTKNGKCFRVYHFVEGGVSFNSTTDPKLFFSAGKAVGFFQNMLANFPINTLHETIPNFHNTPMRYQSFQECLAKTPEEKKKGVENDISFIIDNKQIAYSIQPLLDNGTLPLKATHNDTKINNIMFDYDTHDALCMIDLDTVMSGSVVIDYGDFIRSACNLGKEDSQNLNEVVFAEELFEEFTKGYIKSCAASITPAEVEHLVDGAILMCYELAMRFLQDHFEGNLYFKVKYPDHNLVRARAQIRLCQEILKRKPELDAKVQEIYKACK